MARITKRREEERQHFLRQKQLMAIDLILEGKNDGEVAAAIGVRRQTVNEWRNHHLEFNRELERRRVEHRVFVADEWRQLNRLALSVVRQALEAPDPDVRLALAVLKASGSATWMNDVAANSPESLELAPIPLVIDGIDTNDIQAGSSGGN